MATFTFLEVNPRASRTVPFVAKATDSAIASIAARLMAGEPLSNFPMRAPISADVAPVRAPADGRPNDLGRPPQTPWFSVKEAVLPFARFPGGRHAVGGQKMRSPRAKVMGWARRFDRAFYKAQLGAGVGPAQRRSRVLVDQGITTRGPMMVEAAPIGLVEMGFTIVATRRHRWMVGSAGRALRGGQQSLMRGARISWTC